MGQLLLAYPKRRRPSQFHLLQSQHSGDSSRQKGVQAQGTNHHSGDSCKQKGLQAQDTNHHSGDSSRQKGVASSGHKPEMLRFCFQREQHRRSSYLHLLLGIPAPLEGYGGYCSTCRVCGKLAPLEGYK
eukprot:274428-Chlamydomonas_euryale.AAC.1